jgi:hypothetical protein
MMAAIWPLSRFEAAAVVLRERSTRCYELRQRAVTFGGPSFRQRPTYLYLLYNFCAVRYGRNGFREDEAHAIQDRLRRSRAHRTS